ncbi:uncharacterized protein LOC114524034 [Dendronephthya gigantea]|uniref:uncharacterized protein LOC114524034 n=1 Tax=Dendronephthya gigantea TaxID=151771 RepID=UPI001069370C|nr:uncharacterized protein LOC114524034 [Dendronephthya gigantea]
MENKRNVPEKSRCFHLLFIASFCCLSSSLSKAASTTDNSKAVLSVGDRFLCAENNKDITVRCTLQSTNVNITHIPRTWHLTWCIKGQNVDLNSSIFARNNTMSIKLISNLTVAVNWPNEKVFTCFGSFKEGNILRPKLNISLTVSGRKPTETQVQGIRFIDKSVYKSVEVYWKQSENLDDTYSVQYEVDDEDLVIRNRMLTIGNDKIECSDRKHNIYRVPNTTGRICWVSINKKQHPESVENRIRIITKRGKCETEGPVRKFMLISYYDNQDNSLDESYIELIPPTVSEFEIHVAKQKVSMTWNRSNSKRASFLKRFYHLEYTCPELGVKNETEVEEKNELIMHGSDFTVYRPHAICHFCIQVRLEDSKVFSEPSCRSARLHEERPSEPPRITCDADCATSNDGRFRIVTVTWSLPARKTWNGILTNVAMSYRRADNISRNDGVVEQNVSEGFTTLPKLERNKSYVVQTALCNREGCSEFGRPATLTASLEQNTAKDSVKSSNHANSSVSIRIALVATGSVFLVVIFSMLGLVWQRGNSANPLARPPDLQEPEEYVSMSGSGDQTTDREYDDLSDGVLIEQGERNEAYELQVTSF